MNKNRVSKNEKKALRKTLQSAMTLDTQHIIAPPANFIDFVSKATSVSNNSKKYLDLKAIYLLGKTISSGNFGDVKYGKNIQTGQLIAIKIELSTNPKLLRHEFYIYKIMDKIKGFPKCYHFGVIDQHPALAMELMGPSLDMLFQKCENRFSVNTVAMIALQLIDRMESLHQANFVYQDVKPENFVISNIFSPQHNLIYMLDFGLAKLYRNSKGKHIEFSKTMRFIGTARYMSINGHEGTEQTRRDDLEAVSYMLFYFLLGRLPWQGLPSQKVAGSLQMQYMHIAKVKINVNIDEELVKELPKEFGILLRYARNLKFAEKPNYVYLKKLFRNVLKKNKWNKIFIYDWNYIDIEKSLELKTKLSKLSGELPRPIQNSAAFTNDILSMSSRSNHYHICETLWRKLLRVFRKKQIVPMVVSSVQQQPDRPDPIVEEEEVETEPSIRNHQLAANFNN